MNQTEMTENELHLKFVLFARSIDVTGISL